jgi:hypothetical protein
MTKTIHGKVHGKTIELDEDLGVADGQDVEVQVKVITNVASLDPHAEKKGLTIPLTFGLIFRYNRLSIVVFWVYLYTLFHAVRSSIQLH